MGVHFTYPFGYPEVHEFRLVEMYTRATKSYMREKFHQVLQHMVGNYVLSLQQYHLAWVSTALILQALSITELQMTSRHMYKKQEGQAVMKKLKLLQYYIQLHVACNMSTIV